MNIKISKRFVKDTQAITDQRILAKIKKIILKYLDKNNFLNFQFYPNHQKEIDHRDLSLNR